MTMEVNGPAILMALAKDPTAFSMSPSAINELAANAIMSKLKEKGLSLAALRSLAHALDDSDFRFLIGSMPASNAKALAKLDDKNPDYKGADEHWHRRQIIRLASGEIEPTASVPKAAAIKTPKPPKAPAPPKQPKIGKIMGSEVQKAARSRVKKS